MKVALCDDGDWDFCITEHCINLFRDACPGPASCPRALAKGGIEIHMMGASGEPQYVTTITRKQ